MRKTNSSIWKQIEKVKRVVDRSLRQLGHTDPAPERKGMMVSPEELEELGQAADVRAANAWAKANAPRRGSR